MKFEVANIKMYTNAAWRYSALILKYMLSCVTGSRSMSGWRDWKPQHTKRARVSLLTDSGCFC